MTGPGGAWSSETVWNWYSTEPSDTNGSGGGINFNNIPIPSWQQGINMTTNKGSTTLRNVPDVALTADNIFLVADNGTNYSVGGTSAAAPLWAGFTALINQQAMQPGQNERRFSQSRHLCHWQKRQLHRRFPRHHDRQQHQT